MLNILCWDTIKTLSMINQQNISLIREEFKVLVEQINEKNEVHFNSLLFIHQFLESIKTQEQLKNIPKVTC